MASPNAYAGANHRSVKRSNRATIFRAIRALGPIARITLARQTLLNAGTVTNIVDELLDAGLVSEIGQGVSRVGRRPVLLKVNPTARYAIGIDIARDAISGAIVDLAGHQHQHLHEAAGPWLTGETVLAATCAMIERLLVGFPETRRATLVGIGIGAVGPLSLRSGRFLAPPSFGSWQDLALVSHVQARFGLPTFVDNNGNTSALAELWSGAGQGIDNFVFLSLGTGIGGGLVLDGELYRGEHDVAGELGHLSIDANGPRCACGNYGCLEMYASVPRVLAATRAALATGEPSAIRARVRPGEEPTLDALVAAACGGDPLAVRILADATRALAAGLVTIINSFDPRLVLLGRELASAGDILLEPVRAEVRRRVFPALRDTVRIETTALSGAPTVGAATLALQGFFAAPLSHSTALVIAGR
jgi:N-acetylglucosamine repressor